MKSSDDPAPAAPVTGADDALAATVAPAPGAVADDALAATVAPAPGAVADGALAATAAPAPGAVADGALAATAASTPGLRADRVDVDAELPVVDPAHYQILGEFARGGLGKILRARDHRTGRVVAIKQIIGAHDDGRRFAREARVTANLQHPAIVPVYELGRWPSGEPFYAMKLVAGQSLQEVLDRAPSLDARLALLPELASVADALAYAHGQGVIHRDLKPANVLVGELGETVVIDWGLAKAIGVADRPDADADADALAAPGATVAGAVLGTPFYMSPEQARGLVVDERSDVYAIGTMLYQLVTGQPPFADKRPKTVAQLLALVTDATPTPIAQLAADAPSELIAIAAKAMAKAPADRYPSARELADDLRRFTTGQLVRAHHYGRGALLRRWLRRHRAAVAVAAVMLALLIVVGIASVTRIVSERDSAIAASEESARQSSRAKQALALALFQKGRAAERDQRWATATLYYAASRVQDDTAAARWAAGLAEARAVVPRARHLGHRAAVAAIAISPDGALAASVDEGGALRLWSTRDGATVAALALPDAQLAVAFAPDGHELAAAGASGIVRRYDARLAPLGELTAGARVWSLAYAPDGRALAAGGEDTAITIWELGSSRARVLRGHRQRVYTVAFSADGARLLSGSDDRDIRTWDVAAGTSTILGAHAAGGVRVVGFTPDGRGAYSAGWDNHVTVWRLDGARQADWLDSHSVHAAVITPDQRVLISAGDSGEIRLWELSTRQLITRLDVRGGRTSALAVSRVGAILTAAGPDHVPVVWDLRAVPRLVDGDGHRDNIIGLAWSRDGAQVASSSDDLTLRRWDATTARELARSATDILCGEGVVVLPDGALLAACKDHTLRRWGVDGRERARITTDVWLRFGALAPDGVHYAAGHADGRLAIFDTRADRVALEREATIHDHQVYGVAWNAIGTLVTSSLDNRVKLWTPELAPLRAFTAPTSDGLLTAALSPDGATAIAGTQDGQLLAWRVADGAPLAQAPTGAGTIWRIAFSVDGARVYTAHERGEVAVWDTTRWTVIDRLDAGEGPANVHAIDPTGRGLAVGYRSGALVVWDLATGKPRFRVGGRARELGDCDRLAAQTWVDDAHAAIVRDACTSSAPAYAARVAATTHQRLDGAVDVVPAW